MFYLFCLLIGFALVTTAYGIETFGFTKSPVHIGLYGLGAVLLTIGGLSYAGTHLLSDTVKEEGLLGVFANWPNLMATLPISFAGLCRALFLQFGGFTGVHEGAQVHSILADVPWSSFAYSWLLDSLTFNASQMFGWVTTPIQPVAWWSRLLVVGFSVVADTILFASVVNVIRTVVASLRAGT
jgi:hypothetical protein